MKMARSGMLEARAAGNKHFERGAQLKAQLRREAKEEKAKEQKASKAFKESPKVLGILPSVREEAAVEVPHPCCPEFMEVV